MAAPRVSFVTALRDCLPLTREMLRSLEATVDLADAEIVLVDDGSTDGTRAFLNEFAARPNVSVLLNETNLGFAASNNRGAAIARADTLVLLNNDLVLLDGWLEPMLGLLETAPQAGAVGNIQRNAATGLVDHAGIFFGLDGMPTHAHKNRARPPRGDWRERPAVTAACMAIRKRTFEEAGGFDEGYRNGMEDVDLCIRLKRAGRRHYVSHRSVVLHHVSASPGRHSRNAENSQRFRERHAAYCAQFGRREWPIEYLRRYARHWWKMEPRKLLQALYLLTIAQRTSE